VSKTRIGTPSHLATRPLIFGLTQIPHEDIELVYDEPGSLALALERGELDAALIPSIEFLRGVGEYSVNGPALVAKRPTGSLKLVVNKPLPEVRSIAVDEFTRTPLVILRVVLDKIYHILPDFWVHKAGPLVASDWSSHYDGVLLDGDQGLKYCSAELRPGETCHDVDGMWFSLFSTPLVLSLWAYNDLGMKTTLEQLLVGSRDEGVQNLSQISKEMARRTSYDNRFLHRFYHTAWGFNLGQEEAEGLRALERFAHDYKLLQTHRLEDALVG
jgi:chorismate dehydratase